MRNALIHYYVLSYFGGHTISANRTQLFRERLSEKVHTTIPKGIVGGFKFTGEAMDLCLRVLKESNKSRFDSYSVRKSVLIISHITFRDCRVQSFSDNLSRNSCIWPPKTKRSYRTPLR